MTTSQLFLVWRFDAFDVALLTLATIAYAVHIGSRRASSSRRAFGAFVLALVAFVLVTLSPVGLLSRGYLFTAHMLQHLVLLLVVPLLGLLALPRSALREGGADETNDDLSSASNRSAFRTLASWLLGTSAMWIWHTPALCEAATASPGVEHLQRVSLLAMGAAFWWPLFAPNESRRLAPLLAIAYLFTACVGCTLLGALVTFSPVSVCSVFAHPVDRIGALPLIRGAWGMTPRADQEIGGLLMWVPACVGYLAGILAMLARYYARDGERTSLAREGT